MGREKSQSVIKYEKNVLNWLTENGWTVKRCAQEAKISLGHAYQVLDLVCEKAGIDKKALLRRPHKEHAKFERTPGEPLRAMDPETFNLHCDVVIEEIDKLLAEMREIITDDRELLEEGK